MRERAQTAEKQGQRRTYLQNNLIKQQMDLMKPTSALDQNERNVFNYQNFFQDQFSQNQFEIKNKYEHLIERARQHVEQLNKKLQNQIDCRQKANPMIFKTKDIKGNQTFLTSLKGKERKQHEDQEICLKEEEPRSQDDLAELRRMIRRTNRALSNYGCELRNTKELNMVQVRQMINSGDMVMACRDMCWMRCRLMLVGNEFQFRFFIQQNESVVAMFCVDGLRAVYFIVSQWLDYDLSLGQDQHQLQGEKQGVYHMRMNTIETKVSDKREFMDFVMLKQSELTGYSIEDSFLQSQAGQMEKMRMHNYKNLQYTVDIALGTSFNQFKVVLDTGSANLWIDSSRCQEEGCMKHHQYNAEESQKFRHIGQELSVEFGTGALKGEINSDSVYFGDLELSNQNIAEITEENGIIFREFDFDGILGLAYPQMAPQNFIPVFDNLMQSRKLEKNMFAFYLTNDANDVSHSEFSLGGYNEAHVDGDIHYHKVVDQYYWMMRADNILVDGKDIGLCHNRGCRVIADTGTSIMSAPSDDLGALLKTLDVRDHCHELSTLPQITFILDGVDYTLDPVEYVKPTKFDAAGLTEINDGDDLQAMIEVNNWDCIAAFMPLDIQEPQGPAWILGDVFLRKYYSIYDRDNNVVGLSKAKK